MPTDHPTAEIHLASPGDSAEFPMRVLVIEDDRPTRRLLEKMIRTRGHEVVGSESAETALDLLAERFFPLIVLDIQLPGMSGLEFSRLLREQRNGRYYYILVGTGNNRPEDLKEILDAGSDDYIGKPYHPGLLDVRLAVAEAAVKSIAERRQLESELEFLADHDPLTKLFNRRQLVTAINGAIAEARDGRAGAIFYIDLDNFKIVNDTLGHDVGDRLLLAVADILRAVVRPDDILVRFGGDEFVLILPGCSVSDALSIGEDLRIRLEALVFAEQGRTFRIGASIGVAEIDGTRDAADLLGMADAACYAAKAAGRNRVELYSEDTSAIAMLVADSDWTTRIRRAMRDGTLSIYFQPIVATDAQSILCHEVLLRLNDRPDSDPVHPAAFMNSMQRSGFLPSIDRFVITKSVEALVNRPDIDLSINISGSSFAREGFVDFLDGLMKNYDVSPKQMIFELTENEVIANLLEARSIMATLRERGFRFALDDFGSGASSLTYLKSLPIDLIKIDGSFLRQIDEDPFSLAIVRAVQALALALQIPVVAEFVERKVIFDMLYAMEIEFVQGYYPGRPRISPYCVNELFAAPIA